MSETVIEFRPPAPLLSMNHRHHWTAARRIARTWRDWVCAMAVGTLGAPSARQRGPSTVQVALPVPDRRKRDPHNYELTTKPIVDGLVDAGMWPDDDPRNVQVLPTTLVPGAATVVVTIRPRVDL